MRISDWSSYVCSSDLEPPRPDPDIVQKIDYDAHGKLRFRKDFALYRDGSFPISFQHVGMYFPKTVRMHAVDGGTAREVHYDPTLFTVDPSHVAAGLGEQPSAFRSEEQTSELQSLMRTSYAVFCLKKKT